MAKEVSGLYFEQGKELSSSPDKETEPLAKKEPAGSQREAKTKGTNPSSNQENSGALDWSKKTGVDSPETAHIAKSCLYQNKLRKNWPIFQNLSSSSKDCLICAKKSYKTVIVENLNSKYLTTRESYNTRVVSDIIYNENTHITSIFKDYLVYDDANEFLKRFYVASEIPPRLPKIFNFYDKYSKVFPCYIILEEKRQMFKNIERKQRAIDEKQKSADTLKRTKNAFAFTVLTPEFLRELNKPDSVLGRSSLDLSASTLIQQYSAHTHKLVRKKAAAGGLKELLDNFVARDTLNTIELSQSAILPIKKSQKGTKGKQLKEKEVEPCNRKSSSLQPGARAAQRNPSQFRNKAKHQSRNCQSVIKILSSPRAVNKGKIELNMKLLKKLPLALNRCKSQSGEVKKRTAENSPKTAGKLKIKTIARPSSLASLRQSKQLASSKQLSNAPNRISSRRGSIVPIDKKVIAIDIESLNKNLQKQKLVLDLKSVKGSIKSPSGCSEKTPGPRHKKFKSSYLNSLKQKIEERMDTSKKNTRFVFDNLLAPPKKTALIVKSKAQTEQKAKRKIAKPSHDCV